MKIGDKVKVVKKINRESWISDMDDCIGKFFEITILLEDEARLSCGWFFPIESLELVTDSDVVENPPHYTSGGIECIDAIRSALTPEEFRGYCKGNVLKYIWREKLKGGNEDIKKAIVYAGWIK